MMPLSTGAVIVAAGLSSRMKAFKPMLPLGDSTIIRTVITRLRAGGTGEIALVTGHNAAALREHVADLAVHCLLNPDYAVTDMFHSAGIGLAHMPGRCDRLFFLPGDVPLFAVDSLVALQRCMEESGAQVVIPACGGRRGHPVLIAAAAVPSLLAYRGGMGLKGAIAALGEAVRVVELDDPGLTMDADRPEDYLLLQQYAARSGTLRQPTER